MYSKFIEVHSHDIWDDGRGEVLMSLKLENIVGIMPYADDPQMTLINMVNSDYYVVTESYEDIKQLIHDAGCQIHKPDPRLDAKPLTWEELAAMEGQPVWNSNAVSWGLVVKDPEWAGEIMEGYYLRYSDSSLTRFEDPDLQKYPLYAMKR